MAYLGRGLDKISNIEVLDNITFDGSSSYSITKGSVAFTPNSAQSLLISIDGVVQATNFSVNSSTIDFGVAIPSTSVCNFFLHYGTGVMTVPSDGSVTTAKLGSNAVTSAKMFSGFANGITVADGWRITTGFNGSGDTFITSGWEQIDDASFGSLGSAMTQSSGVFTFPSTGIYLVQFQMSYHTAINGYVKGRIWITTDNSSYDKVAESIGYLQAGELSAQYCFALVDVTNTSNVKAKFGFNGANASSGAYGSTTDTQTGANFIRLGDT